MPELPEVEIITRGLKKEIIGKKIESVVVLNNYRTSPPSKVFSEQLKGVEITEATRIAKVVTLALSKNQQFLTFHLAMTGRLLLRKKTDATDAYTRVIFKFTDEYELRFSDLRMFGYAKLLSLEELGELKEKYGPSPFTKGLDTKKLHSLLASKKGPIKKLLLDQSIIAGLGNIYANDALWIAKIHPEQNAGKLTLENTEKLLAAMQEILTEGIKNGGSTIKDFVDIYGNPGSQQKHFRVYAKAGQPCMRCSTLIVGTELGGRSTFHCPTCQKLSADATGALKLW